MKKFISLLKAVLTEDMDLIRVNKDLKGTRKIITVFIFAFIIMFAFLQILYPLFKQMNSINSCYTSSIRYENIKYDVFISITFNITSRNI